MSAEGDRGRRLPPFTMNFHFETHTHTRARALLLEHTRAHGQSSSRRRAPLKTWRRAQVEESASNRVPSSGRRPRRRARDMTGGVDSATG